MSMSVIIGSLCILISPLVSEVWNNVPPRPLEATATLQNNIKNKVDTTVYLLVEMPPEFPGGRIALFHFIKSASKYRITGNRNQASGAIHLKLLVEKDGTVSDAIILSTTVGKEHEDEIKRIVGSMPKWKPGYHSGRRLRVYSLISVYFL